MHAPDGLIHLDRLFAFGCQRCNWLLALMPGAAVPQRGHCQQCLDGANYTGWVGEMKGGPKGELRLCNLHGMDYLRRVHGQHQTHPMLFTNFTSWAAFSAVMQEGRVAWITLPPDYSVVDARRI